MHDLTVNNKQGENFRSFCGFYVIYETLVPYYYATPHNKNKNVQLLPIYTV